MDSAPTPKPDPSSQLPSSKVGAESTDISIAPQTLLQIFNLARVGLSKARWNVAPKQADAYKAVRAALRKAGLLPS